MRVPTTILQNELTGYAIEKTAYGEKTFPNKFIKEINYFGMASLEKLNHTAIIEIIFSMALIFLIMLACGFLLTFIILIGSNGIERLIEYKNVIPNLVILNVFTVILIFLGNVYRKIIITMVQTSMIYEITKRLCKFNNVLLDVNYKIKVKEIVYDVAKEWETMYD